MIISLVKIISMFLSNYESMIQLFTTTKGMSDILENIDTHKSPGTQLSDRTGYGSQYQEHRDISVAR